MPNYLWKLRKIFKSKPKPSFSAKRVNVNVVVEQKATIIINLVGYTILFLTFLDYIALFVTPQFFNPVWAWETAGKFVENVWPFLLGFLLVFYRRERDSLEPKELTFLSWLSWLALILAAIYFLMTPVLIGNAFRINRSQQARLTQQISQEQARVQQYNQRLERASNEQLNNLLQTYQKQAPELKLTSSQQLKNNLLSQIQQQQQKNQKQLQSNFSQQKINLIKTTLKWFIGAIISGVAFILIWRHTRWARVLIFTNN